ncbi:MAG: IPT/TIG domain-containing protein [Marinilabiliaceae bacterium]|nr:IPT/TIG domain-containing protein [Marinilabiliaceae bacterium]
MKRTILSYFKIVTFGLLISGLAFSACSDDDDDNNVKPAGPATVTGYNPGVGTEGAGVIISGTNFSVIPTENKVLFNGVEATVRSVSSTTILTSVPVGSTTGPVSVSVNNAAPAEGPAFTVLLPTITALDPVAGGVGETVTLTGTNFSATKEENKLWFNGVEAVVTAATSTSITTSVPQGATTGVVSVAVDNGTKVTGSEFTVTNFVTIDISILNEEDDVEEAETGGAMEIGSSDLELGEIDGDFGAQTIGTRFRNVSIPKGAKILSASIQFSCDDTGAGPVNLRIHGEDVGNSAVYTDALFNVTSRVKTTTSVLWTIPEWAQKGERSDAQKTIDLAAIVQEIVDREDWAANNSLNFIFTQEGENSSTGGNGREAETYGGDGEESESAALKIVYEL